MTRRVRVTIVLPEGTRRIRIRAVRPAPPIPFDDPNSSAGRPLAAWRAGRERQRELFHETQGSIAEGELDDKAIAAQLTAWSEAAR